MARHQRHMNTNYGCQCENVYAVFATVMKCHLKRRRHDFLHDVIALTFLQKYNLTHQMECFKHWLD